MIVERLDLTVDEFHRLSGWEVKPEGACKAEVCVPLPAEATRPDGRLDVAVVAERLGMPMVHDEVHGVWAFGPESGGRALESATFPDLVLTDFQGDPYDFTSARGRKLVMVAWASW